MHDQRLNLAWAKMLARQQYTHAVTFKPNWCSGPISAKWLLNCFVNVHMRVDRQLLGTRFSHPSKDHLRSQAVGIVEGLPNNGHLHGAFRIRPENWLKFEDLFSDGTTQSERTGIWRKLVPNGSSIVERIYEPQGWFDYALKNVWQCDDADRVVFLPLRR